jgi:hypothetical protein
MYFCISYKDTNITIAGELGRYSLFLEVILNMIKYFIHLSNPICTGLVAEAFEASRKLHLENKRSSLKESGSHFPQSTYSLFSWNIYISSFFNLKFM